MFLTSVKDQASPALVNHLSKQIKRELGLLRPLEVYDVFMAFKGLNRSSTLHTAVLEKLDNHMDKLSCRELLKVIEVCSSRELN